MQRCLLSITNMIYTIENNYLKASITSLGATLTSLINKRTNRDIVLGFNNEEEYLANRGPYFGTTVARNANRIRNASFTINGIAYNLEKNDNGNNLHSGGYSCFRHFELDSKSDTSITFKMHINNLEDLFPGNFDLYVKYELNDDKLRIIFTGLSDQDTLFNVTNHTYFNLDGGLNDILNHEMKIYTDKVSYGDSMCISTDKTLDVTNTSFDFKDFRSIGDNIKRNHENLQSGGIDHNFEFSGFDFKEMVSIRNKDTQVDIYSDMPCTQVYTGNCIGDVKGKNDYLSFYGIAVEPQYHPDAINLERFDKPILKANIKTSHVIEYHIH